MKALQSINEDVFNQSIESVGVVHLELQPSVVCSIREGYRNTFDCRIVNQKIDFVVREFSACNLEQIRLELDSTLNTIQ